MKSDSMGLPKPQNLAHIHPLSSLAQELIIRGFSRRTIKSYLAHNQQFLNFIGKSPREVTAQDIKDYLLYLKSKNYSNTSLNSVISSLKFYYQQVLRRKLFFNIHRPKREKFLPVILHRDEVVKIINSTDNLKHKLLLSILYGSGLRVSEVVKLKIADVDILTGRVFVRDGKGNKDRYTLLSKHSARLFEIYFKKIAGQAYLFSGANGEGHLTQRSAQKIFDKAIEKIGLTKKVSCHSLRHSFASHLLANGVDIRYIQKLLGHKNIKTTEQYTHTAGDFLSKISSPL